MRFQAYLLAAFAAVAAAQSSDSSSASSASSVSSSASAASSSSSASESSSSSAASTSSTASSSITSSASAAKASSSSSSSSDDDEETTSTRVYTTTYFYITENPTHNAVSPTIMKQSVVKSTSGMSDQMSFSTPTGRVTVLDIKKSTYTTTYTSENPIHAVMKQYYTITTTVTTTSGLATSKGLGTTVEDYNGPDSGARKVLPIGGLASFFLGLAALL